MNPINWGNSPMAVGLLRGIAAAVLTGVLYALKSYFIDGLELNMAIGMGAIPAVTALLVLLGYGAADQGRVGAGKINAGDVPVAIEAKIANVTPASLARTMSTKSARALNLTR